MATLNLSTSGNDHGWLHPGWSQEESASPHVIGDQDGATRQTSFSAVAGPDSDLLIGKTILVDGVYAATGPALESTLRGDMVTTSTYDIDSHFLPVRKIPAVASGWEEAALDLFQRLYGAPGVTLPWVGRGDVHAYYPLRGYIQGFTVDGQNAPYFQPTWSDMVARSFLVNSWYWGKHAVPGEGFVRLDRGVYANYARILHNSLSVGDNVNYQAMRVALAPGSTIRSRISHQWTGYAYSTNIYVDISGTTGTAAQIVVSGEYRQFGATGAPTPIATTTLPLTGLSTANDIAMVMQWGFLSTAENATLRLKVYAYDPANPPAGAPPLVTTIDMPNSMRARLQSQNTSIRTTTASGPQFGFRDVISSQTDNTWPVHYPVVPEPDLIDIDIVKDQIGEVAASSVGPSARGGAIHAWEGSGWDYLKMLCSARRLQMSVVDGKLSVTNLFPVSSVQPLKHAVDEPTLSIQAAGRSRSVDVVCHGLTVGRGATLDNILRFSMSTQIEVGKETTIVIDLPPGEHLYGTITPTGLTDATGRIQSWPGMFYSGATLTPTIDADGRLTIVIRGPNYDDIDFGSVPDTLTGPWRLTELTIYNQGWYERNSAITLYTGAPEEMVTREKGGNVDNPFLCRVSDVFDAGSWLVSSEGSPHLTLEFTIPASARHLYPIGGCVSYGWGVFRIMDVHTEKAVSQVSCDWFASQAQQSANWVGQTANTWNTYWAGKRAYDVFLRPLASPSPVSNPAPFVRTYPSESRGGGGSLYGSGVYGDGVYGDGVYGG